MRFQSNPPGSKGAAPRKFVTIPLATSTLKKKDPGRGEQIIFLGSRRSMDRERLGDGELLELVLVGRNTEGFSGMGSELLRRFSGLRGLSRAGHAELCTVPGIGGGRAERVQALMVLARRFSHEPLLPGRPYRSATDIYRHLRSTLRDLKKERFLIILLDGKNRVMGERLISEGSLNASLVHPREVFSPAIRESAGSIVLVHNHPSGDPTPSLEDIEVTRRLRSVGDLVGIRVLDHVIIGEECYTSFLEQGLFDRLPAHGQVQHR